MIFGLFWLTFACCVSDFAVFGSVFPKKIPRWGHLGLPLGPRCPRCVPTSGDRACRRARGDRHLGHDASWRSRGAPHPPPPLGSSCVSHHCYSRHATPTRNFTRLVVDGATAETCDRFGRPVERTTERFRTRIGAVHGDMGRGCTAPATGRAHLCPRGCGRPQERQSGRLHRRNIVSRLPGAGI